MWCSFVISSLIIIIETEGIRRNGTGLLISRYAKVSHNILHGNDRRTEAYPGRMETMWNHR